MESELERILGKRQLQILLQPIVDCQQHVPLGYEALARGPDQSPLHLPSSLFALAKEQGRQHELELLCLDLAMQHFCSQHLPGRLFANLSPSVLLAVGHQPLLALCRQHGLAPASLVLELTEYERIDALPALLIELAALKQAGVAIAIDDLGSGHSGLLLWSALRPEFIKLDIHFTSGLDQDLTKRQFVTTLHDLACQLGCTLISEGVEREAELKALRQIGVRYCQGYLLGRPSKRPTILFDTRRDPAFSPQLSGNRVGKLAQSVPTLTPDMRAEEILALFKQSPQFGCFPVLDSQQRPLGIVRRQSLLARLADRFGYSLYAKAPANKLMDTPILVEANQSLIEVSQHLVDSNSDEMEAWFVICQQGTYVGMGRVRELMRRLTHYKLQVARHANPLTLLPGNVPIQQAMTRAMQRARPFWLAYCDLNHFKPFNDVCGYDRGDQMIKLVARLLRKVFEAQGAFIGHLGGDDFILIGESPQWESLLYEVQQAFRSLRTECYRQQDIERGHIVALDRDGQERTFDLVDLAIGAISWHPECGMTQSQLSEQLTQAKKQAKAADGHLWYETLRPSCICA